MYYKKLNSLFWLGLSLFSLVACKNSPLSKGAPLEMQTLWEKRIEGGFYVGDWVETDTNLQTFFIASRIKNNVNTADTNLKNATILLTQYSKTGAIEWQQAHEGYLPNSNGSHNSFRLLGDTVDYHIRANGQIDTIGYPLGLKSTSFCHIKQANRALLLPKFGKTTEGVWATTGAKFSNWVKLPNEFKVEVSDFLDFGQVSISPINPNLQLLIADKNKDTSLLIATDANGIVLWQYAFEANIKYRPLLTAQTQRNIFWANDGGVFIVSNAPTAYLVVVTKIGANGQLLFSTPPMVTGSLSRHPSATLQIFEDNSFLFVGRAPKKEDLVLFRYDAKGRLLWQKEHSVVLKEGQMLNWLDFARMGADKFVAIAQILSREEEVGKEKYKSEARLVIFSEQGDWKKDAILPAISSAEFNSQYLAQAKLYPTKAQNLFLCAWMEDFEQDKPHIILQNIQLQ